MARTTEHLEHATADSRLKPDDVFEVVSDLELLPAWFFDNDPHPQTEHPRRTVIAVDDRELRAHPGVSVDIESTDGYGTLRGRRIKIVSASTDRFTCTDVDDGSSVRFIHESLLYPRRDGHLATRVGITEPGVGCTVTVTHETRVTGRGLRAVLLRWVRGRTSVTQRLMVRRLIAVADAHADSGTRTPPGDWGVEPPEGVTGGDARFSCSVDVGFASAVGGVSVARRVDRARSRVMLANSQSTRTGHRIPGARASRASVVKSDVAPSSSARAT